MQTVTGKMKVEYTSKKTGLPVKGTNIFIAEPIKSDYGEGMIVDKKYVSESVVPYADIKLQKCEVRYDKDGNIKEILY